MKKRAASLFLSILAIWVCIVPAYAAQGEAAAEPPVSAEAPGDEAVEISEPEVVLPVSGDICLDGVVAACVEHQNVDGTCYVTVRSFASLLDPEAMVEDEGGVVTVSACSVAGVVDAGAGQAGVENETLTLVARSGEVYIEANGRCLYVVNGVRTVNGAVAVPVRVLSKAFNLNVEYNAANGVIYLSRQAGTSAYLTPGWAYYNETDLYWLSHIINAESGNQPMAGKIAVGNVVMNRVASPLFPNNVYDVLFQRNQFTPAYNGSIYKNPTAASTVAAKLVLEGVVVVPGALFFNVAGMTSYASRYRTYVTTIGAHSFYI